MLGHVRDNFARSLLPLPGREGVVNVEFIIDTGFDGELALPASLLDQLAASYIADHYANFADGSLRKQPVYEMRIETGCLFRSVRQVVVETRCQTGCSQIS